MSTPPPPPTRKEKNKLRRANLRRYVFTVGPDRLTGGRLAKRHLGQGIVVRAIEITSPRWPKAFDGLRIAHVSDFHLGDLLPVNRALEIVDRIGELEPDLVACTGDVVDLHHHEAPPLLKAMVGLDAPMGALLVLGNHDELHCRHTLTRLAEQAGMIVLADTTVDINHNGEHLTVGGIRWAKSRAQCAVHVERTCAGGDVDLLLAHNPKAFLHAAQLDVPLTLAGHTHGGQLAMKNRPNTNLALTHRRSAGLFQKDESFLYVTAGVGAWFPLRVNCPAELVAITMRHGPAQAGPVDNGVH